VLDGYEREEKIMVVGMLGYGSSMADVLEL